MVHISTGDLLRAAVKAGTALGKTAGALMEAGKLVPDELIIGIVNERMSQDDCKQKGWLLDGFPRTEAQAAALTKAGVTADAFLYLNVPDELLVERVVGRRSDPETGKIYHMTFNKPPEDDAELIARLVQRKDDTEECCQQRLVQFHSHINAVRGLFADKMHEIDGAKPKAEVFRHICTQLDKALAQ